MTITRRWQTGFELNDLDYECSQTSAATTSTAYTGSYSLSFSTAEAYWYIPVTTQVRVGFFFAPGVVGTSPVDFLILFLNATEVITLVYDGTTFTLAAGATTLGTYTPSPPLSTNVFVHFGLDVKIDASAGWANLYLNGVAVITFSGDTNDGGAQFDRVCIGPLSGSWGGTAAKLDDLYIDDTTGEAAAAALPLKRFYYVLPSGDGNYSQWDGSDGNSLLNYALVDERPPTEATDYVYTATSTDRDSYAMANVTLGAGESVIAVIPIAVGYNPAGGSTLKLSTRLGGVDVDSAAKPMSVDWDLIWDRQTTKPGGGAWSGTDVNNMEVGITQV